MKALDSTHQKALRPSPRGQSSAQSPAGASNAAIAEHAAIVDAIAPPHPVPPRPTFLRSFVYAGRGLWHALRTQRNMRVHVAAALLAIALGIALRISAVEFAVIFLAIAGVLVAEMFNTVTEALADLATHEYHPLARVAKDVAAGAVLLSAILAVVIALFVYLPHLRPLLHLFGH
jgi:diacylglycerol kinase